MRLPQLHEDELTPAAREVWASVTEGRRRLAPAGDVLPGPFGAMLHAPVPGLRYSQLGEAIRFDLGLDDRLREVATLAVGARWRSAFELSEHRRLAAAAGVPEDMIEMAATGGELPEGTPERLVQRFTDELLGRHEVSDETYGEAIQLLGLTGVVELTFVVGYYCLICATCNAFELEP